MKLKDSIAQRAKENQGQRTDLSTNLSECSRPIDTRQTIAQAAGLSEGTIHKIEVIQELAEPELINKDNI